MLRRLAFASLLLCSVPALAAPTIEVSGSRVTIDQSPSLSTDAVFEVGETAFKKEATALLDEIAKALVKEGKSDVVIDVHSDDSAPDGDRTGAYLRKLSQARADAIKAYLARKGVPARRLTARGRGAEQPASSNNSEDGRRSNRRIEMSIEAEIRPPVAADLATYLKNVKGTGTVLMATIDTSLGSLHCTLFEDKAPMTVANFVGLATGQKAWVDPKTTKTVKGKPFYDGLIFHRVIPGFMVQGGDPLGLGTGGPGYQFADEIHPEVRNVPGTLAMANAGPRTNGSQFFINEVRSQHLDNRHTVFGQCREVELVQKIANAPRDAGDRPQPPVVIKKVTIARQQPAAPPPAIGPKQPGPARY
jgi:peptidyl-prolyl cis-trans isomerase A (cyclophilin A)